MGFDKAALLDRAYDLIREAQRFEPSIDMRDWISDYHEMRGWALPGIWHGPSLPPRPAWFLCGNMAMRKATREFYNRFGDPHMLDDVVGFVQGVLSWWPRYCPWAVQVLGMTPDGVLEIDIRPCDGSWEREYALRLGPDVSIEQARYWAFFSCARRLERGEG